MMNDQWRCTSCHWTGPQHEIRKELYFAETRLEPEEWVWYCPDCNKTETLEEVEVTRCRHCEDEPVQHEGDLCSECYTEECERYVDASRGH